MHAFPAKIWTWIYGIKNSIDAERNQIWAAAPAVATGTRSLELRLLLSLWILCNKRLAVVTIYSRGAKIYQLNGILPFLDLTNWDKNQITHNNRNQISVWRLKKYAFFSLRFQCTMRFVLCSLAQFYHHWINAMHTNTLGKNSGSDTDLLSPCCSNSLCAPLTRVMMCTISVAVVVCAAAADFVCYFLSVVFIVSFLSLIECWNICFLIEWQSTSSDRTADGDDDV